MKQVELTFVNYGELVRCNECDNWHDDRYWCKRLSHSVTAREAKRLIKCKHHKLSKEVKKND